MFYLNLIGVYILDDIQYKQSASLRFASNMHLTNPIANILHFVIALLIPIRIGSRYNIDSYKIAYF